MSPRTYHPTPTIVRAPRASKISTDEVLGNIFRNFCIGNMCTPGVLKECTKEEDAVLLSAYRSNGSKVRGVVTPNNNYATGVWDTSKPFDEQETVYHMDGKQYNARGGKYVEVQETQINKEKKEPIPFHKVAQTPTFNAGDANEFSK